MHFHAPRLVALRGVDDEEREQRDRVSQVVRGEERERRKVFSHVKLLDTALLAAGEERDCDERFSHIL